MAQRGGGSSKRVGKNEINQGSSLKQRSFLLPVNKSERSQRIGLLLFYGKTRQPV